MATRGSTTSIIFLASRILNKELGKLSWDRTENYVAIAVAIVALPPFNTSIHHVVVLSCRLRMILFLCQKKIALTLISTVNLDLINENLLRINL